jgi:cyclic-di-GMP-binding protein
VPSFDVVSELDAQEVRNAVDQVSREVATRFDFKGVGAGVELGKDGMTLRAGTEDRLKALRTLIEEKFVRRKLSLKALDWGRIEEAAGGTVRQEVGLKNGISADAVKDLNKRIKALGLKGVQSSGQGDSLRVSSKKRDELQAVQAALREADLDYPIQFTNRRD